MREMKGGVMPRKPDRFERMVKQIFGVIASTNPESARLEYYMYREDAVKLLRRQHRAMVRIVESMPRQRYLVSDSLMRSAVIETLKQYAK